MAREKHTIDDLEAAARYLEQSAAQVRESVELLRKCGLAELLIHGNVIVNRYLPAIWSWACHLPFEARVQSEDFTHKRPTQAALVKARSTADTASRKRKSKGTP